MPMMGFSQSVPGALLSYEHQGRASAGHVALTGMSLEPSRTCRHLSRRSMHADPDEASAASEAAVPMIQSSGWTRAPC